MKHVDSILNILMTIFMIISKCLLVIMTVIICVAVFFRHVLNSGLSWTDEVSLLFMMWFGFIAVSYGVKEDLHISVELFYNMFPKKLKFIVYKFNLLVTAILGCVLAFYAYGLMQTTMTNYMTATGWPTALRYAPVGICGVFMAIFAFRRLIGNEEIPERASIDLDDDVILEDSIPVIDEDTSTEESSDDSVDESDESADNPAQAPDDDITSHQDEDTPIKEEMEDKL